MTLIPIMIPLQTGQPIPAPDPGTGLGFFFDAQKRTFNIRIGLPIARQRQARFTHHGILRKHASSKARLYSRLGKQETQRAASSILLSRGRRTALDSSELSLQKTIDRRTSGGAYLSLETVGKAGGQASIRKTETAKKESGASLSRKQDKSIGTGTRLKRQKKNRAEAHAEPEDDSELVAALDE